MGLPFENGNFGSYQEENGPNDGRVGQDGSALMLMVATMMTMTIRKM